MPPRPGKLDGVIFLNEIRENGACAAGGIQILTIIGQIEGHQLLPEDTKTTKYEHVMPLLAAAEESPEVAGLLVLVNTVGGDIEAGLGIAELIAGMKKPTAAMTIHPVRLNGVVIGVEQTWAYFSKTQERIVRFITENSRISREKLLEYMLRTGEMANDVGSILGSEEAVGCGLIDEVGGLADALGWLHGQSGN